MHASLNEISESENDEFFLSDKSSDNEQQLPSEYVDKIGALAEELVETFGQMNSESNEEIAQYARSQSQTLQNCIQQREEEVALLKRELSYNQTRIKELKEAQKQSYKQNEITDAKEEFLKKKITQLNMKLMELMEEIEKAKTERDFLKRKVEHLQLSMTENQMKSEKRIVQLVQQVRVNQHKVKRSQARSDKMKSRLLQLFEEHESLQTYVSQLETSIVSMQCLGTPRTSTHERRKTSIISTNLRQWEKVHPEENEEEQFPPQQTLNNIIYRSTSDSTDASTYSDSEEKTNPSCFTILFLSVWSIVERSLNSTRWVFSVWYAYTIFPIIRIFFMLPYRIARRWLIFTKNFIFKRLFFFNFWGAQYERVRQAQGRINRHYRQSFEKKYIPYVRKKKCN